MLASVRMVEIGEALGGSQTLDRGLIVEIEHPLLGMARSLANLVRLSGTPPEYRLPHPLWASILKRSWGVWLWEGDVAELRRELAV